MPPVVLRLMRTRLLILVAVMATIPARAQEPRSQPSVNVLDLQSVPGMEVPQPPEPPAGDDAWSLRVHTSGGFTGQGIGSVTISSDGRVACGPSPCAAGVATLTASSVAPIRAALTSIIEGAWIRRSSVGFCSDCIRTTIALKRREGGVVRTFVASWDDSQSPAAELRELRRLAFELRAQRTAQR